MPFQYHAKEFDRGSMRKMERMVLSPLDAHIHILLIVLPLLSHVNLFSALFRMKLST